MANTESGDQTPQRPGFTFPDRRDDVGSALLRHSFQPGELTFLEAIDVSKIFNKIVFDELVDQGRAEVLDIHLAPTREVSQSLLQLARAIRIEASDVDTLFIFGDGRAASRTLNWNLERFGAGVSEFDLDLHDLWDNLAGLFDYDGIVIANVEPFQLIEVVQARAFDRRAG